MEQIFSQLFILMKKRTIVVTFFRKITELALNWSNLNRAGQIGQIDDLDDTNCTIASKLSKNKKEFSALHIMEIFTYYSAQWVWQKVFESYRSRLEPGNPIYFFPFYNGKTTKTLPIVEKNWKSGTKSFSWERFYKI